ncbi:hypothetical protein AKJ16_DCAP12095, partial [Drosera capensis]
HTVCPNLLTHSDPPPKKGTIIPRLDPKTTPHHPTTLQSNTTSVPSLFPFAAATITPPPNRVRVSNARIPSSMATLVPGVLLQLLQHMNTPINIAGDHRSSLLQVVSIVPSLAGGDLFQNRGFYLKVSDSSHATYVSLPDDDEDLIMSDKIQLGQYVHVERFEAASSVPILRGVRPVLGRHPCVGNPVDIVAADSLAFLALSPKGKSKTGRVSSNGGMSKGLVKEEKEKEKEKARGVIARSKSMAANDKKKQGNGNGNGNMWGKKEVKGGVRSVPSSPISCYSVAESFGRFSNEVRQQAKVRSERGVAKMGFGLVEKVSAKLGLREKVNSSSVGSVLAKKQSSPRVEASTRNPVQGLELGPKGLRKSWEGNMSSDKQELKSSAAGRSSVSKRNSLSNERPSSNSDNIVGTPRLSKQDIKNTVSMKSVTKAGVSDDMENSSRKKDSSGRKSLDSTKGSFMGSLVKVSASSRKLTEESVAWTSLPPSLSKLGKEVLKRRDAAQMVVVEAMQEASVAEIIVRCLSKFSELSSAAKEDDPQPAVEQFLALFSTLSNGQSIASFLSKSASAGSSQTSEDILAEETLQITSNMRKQAASWVNAALASDLRSFSVYVNRQSSALVSTSSLTANQKTNTVDQSILVIEGTSKNAAPKTQLKPRQSVGTKVVSPLTPRKGVGDKLPIVQKPQLSPTEWASGSGLAEVIALAEKLKTESQDWFLGFTERFLDSNVDRPTLTDNSQIAGMLTQLKSVNDWLEEIGSKKGEDEVAVLQDTIERLRKKIYEYLLSHVDSAATAALGSQSSPPVRVAEAKARK